MKRSEVNAILADAERFVRERGFPLPPFGGWSPERWASTGPEARDLARLGLGWDVTDFGLGDFERRGLVLFTLRNGEPADLAAGRGKLYAEKLLVARAGQITPWHFHWRKTEDIINRGGGRLQLRLRATDASEQPTLDPVSVSVDGIERTVEAGGALVLEPGESITLPPGLYHEFTGLDSTVLVGEVSTVNDDANDNRFLDPVGRFPEIEEDEAPTRLLTIDYPRWYPHAGAAGSAY